MDHGLAMLLVVVVVLLLLWLGITIGYRFWVQRAALDDNRWTDDASAAEEIFGQRAPLDATDHLDIAQALTDPAPHRAAPVAPDDAGVPSTTAPRCTQQPMQRTPDALAGLRATPDDAASVGRGGLPMRTPVNARILQLPPLLAFAKAKSGGSADENSAAHGGGASLAQPPVLSVLLLPQSGPSLDGSLTLAALKSQQMILGRDQFYHRYAGSAELDGMLLFSAAQLEPPGSLNHAALENAAIPGMVLFIGLAQAVQADVALDAMIQTAGALAKQLNAVVCDANRTNLTLQSVNYMRQQINEFTRRQLLVS